SDEVERRKELGIGEGEKDGKAEPDNEDADGDGNHRQGADDRGQFGPEFSAQGPVSELTLRQVMLMRSYSRQASPPPASGRTHAARCGSPGKPGRRAIMR